MKRFISCLVCVLVILAFTCIGHAQEEKPFEFAVYGGWASGAYGADAGNYGFGFALDVPLIKEDPYGNMLSGEIFFSWNHGEKGYPAEVTEATGLESAILQTTTVNADLKYTLRNVLPSVNLYGLGGVGVYIYEVDYNPPLLAEDFLVPGVIYPEGEKMPFGWAHTDFGFQVGTGLDYKILAFLSLGIDYRYNIVTRQDENNFHQVFSKIAFHF